MFYKFTNHFVGQTEGGNAEGRRCHFPFIYETMAYSTCIDINHRKPWCSVTPNFDEDGRWGECTGKS